MTLSDAYPPPRSLTEADVRRIVREELREAPLDGEAMAKAVTRAVLKKAARGPSSLVGGALLTADPERLREGVEKSPRFRGSLP